MGYVLVVSLPMVILFIMLSFGCFVMGRNKGRQEGRALAAQELGINPQSQGMVSVVDGVMVPPGTPPAPPPPLQHPAFPSVPSPHQPAFPSPTPHHPNTLYLKQQNGMIAA
ncbi:hypothetical protein ERO13_D05G145801v2 [Gossypium hirsutum]|uniref:Espin-like n=5 Tax=Gossypium TaxID=3633 RepID=A0A1U8J333_GOSHI|nr:uncharacterized protein LOC107903209 [Gossypium hirsutum]KAB2029227.1 hypothetical protein ES319_D05G148700v1 [Gossypium barbadense]TYG68477.1 hypothetical protein ES288_D05G156400v1 [Gossypium darwinii]TYH71038.1 hypothetical protein ES332_D05G157400v1 [Gossypium tomentosum]TYI81451.1 hypothetical protein E1A91_D05G154900v1 [Gossypium mustelinum]KAG4146248.1 hypothetical protein ERO13_D05G145801v2 [Gossypium hirsutum]